MDSFAKDTNTTNLNFHHQSPVFPPRPQVYQSQMRVLYRHLHREGVVRDIDRALPYAFRALFGFFPYEVLCLDSGALKGFGKSGTLARTDSIGAEWTIKSDNEITVVVYFKLHF